MDVMFSLKLLTMVQLTQKISSNVIRRSIYMLHIDLHAYLHWTVLRSLPPEKKQWQTLDKKKGSAVKK